MTREEELRLVQRFQNGDTTSFEALVDMFREKGYSLSYQWTNDREDALDILQEAFIKMYKVIPKWKPNSSLFTWLYRVIINRAIDLNRKKKRASFISTAGSIEESGQEIEIKAPDFQQPDRITSSKELGAWIYNEAMKLPRRQKEVFILKYYQEMKLKDIAELCNSPIGTVKANLFQAIQKLRSGLVEFKDIGSGENG